MIAREVWTALLAAKQRRAEAMPTVDDCLHAMGDAHQRLRELGWNDAIYCPKDGTVFDAIEFGSTGVHACHYDGEWPNGNWWVSDGGDLWPSRPVMYRPAQGIEAASAGETQRGSTVGESPVLEEDAPKGDRR